MAKTTAKTRQGTGTGAGAPSGGHRERLLAAALECLRERGYARTTARDLVAVSGTNLASIGYHFGGKEALLQEAIAEGFRAWASEMEQAALAPSHGTPAVRLGASLRAFLARFEELRPFMIAFVEAFPQAVRSPQLSETLARAYEDVRATSAEAIGRALEQNGTELDHDRLRALASALIALCDGLILQWLLDPRAVPDADLLLSGLAGLSGLGPDLE